MRLLAILVLPVAFVLLSASALLRGDDNTPTETPYYPLQVGTRWEYKVNDKDRYVSRVAKHAPFNNVKCAWVETLSDGNVIGVEYLAGNKDGLCRYGFNKEVADPPVVLLKLPPKVGDSWTVNAKIKTESLKGTFKVVGQSRIKVAAGEYQALHVESKDLDVNGLKGTMSVYYAENVGMVKQSMQVGTMKVDLELEKFTPGKASK